MLLLFCAMIVGTTIFDGTGTLLEQVTPFLSSVYIYSVSNATEWTNKW